MGAGVAASPRSPRLPIAPPRPGDHPLGGWVPERGETPFGSRGSRTERERSGASRRQGLGPRPAAPPGGSTGGRTLPFRLAPEEGEPPSLAAVREQGEPHSLPWLWAEASSGLPPPPRATSGQARLRLVEGRVPGRIRRSGRALTGIGFGAIPSASPGLGIAFRAEALQVLPGRLPSPAAQPLARPSGRRVPPPSPQPSESVTILGSDGFVSVGGGLRKIGALPLRPPSGHAR
ncbi:MAG: hypothetical protein QOG84_1828 [Sphingomonadales bacterium]|jgi:hypothetical protein|nr:hypothetical protein [Sphingomonadales bacterium]